MDDEQIIDSFLEQSEEDQTIEEQASETPAPEAEADQQIDQFLDENDKEPGDSEIDKAAKKGNKTAKKLKEEKDKEKGDEDEDDEDEDEDKKKKLTLNGMFKALGNSTDRLHDWSASLPTPGGIMPLLIAIIFFLWIIIPVNADGDTRASLLWGIVTGRVQFSADLLPDNGEFGGNSNPQGGNFGNGSISPAVVATFYNPDFGGDWYG